MDVLIKDTSIYRDANKGRHGERVGQDTFLSLLIFFGMH